ncbi:MAG: ribbon-helix-helix protein, CopG family [Nitriliruptoraceae bacterium]
MVQLTDELLTLLDEEAAERGLSRSALIRTILDDHLDARRRATITGRIIAGYRRLPPTSPDRWGDPARSGDAATRELLQRLDDEEQHAGNEPW